MPYTNTNIIGINQFVRQIFFHSSNSNNSTATAAMYAI